MKNTPTDANKEVWFYGKDKTKEMYEIFSYDPQKVKIFSIVMVNPLRFRVHTTLLTLEVRWNLCCKADKNKAKDQMQVSVCKIKRDLKHKVLPKLVGKAVMNATPLIDVSNEAEEEASLNFGSIHTQH